MACLQSDFRLSLAHDGEQGIAKAIDEIPDVVVSDVMMPRKDGYELCDSLKRDERTNHIPIILLTAKADAASKLSGLKLGADAYLSSKRPSNPILQFLDSRWSFAPTKTSKYALPARRDPSISC